MGSIRRRVIRNYQQSNGYATEQELRRIWDAPFKAGWTVGQFVDYLRLTRADDLRGFRLIRNGGYVVSIEAEFKDE